MQEWASEYLFKDFVEVLKRDFIYNSYKVLCEKIGIKLIVILGSIHFTTYWQKFYSKKFPEGHVICTTAVKKYTDDDKELMTEGIFHDELGILFSINHTCNEAVEGIARWYSRILKENENNLREEVNNVQQNYQEYVNNLENKNE